MCIHNPSRNCDSKKKNMKINIKSANIFFALFFLGYFFMLLKEFIGIGFGYHPDSLHYFEHSEIITSGSVGFFKIFSKLHYFLVDLIKYPLVLFIINIALYAICGSLIYKGIQVRFEEQKINFRIFVFFMIFVSDFYFLHLSSTGLKETIITSLAIIAIYLFMTRRFFFAALPFVLLLGYRLEGLVYFLPLCLKLRPKYIFIIAVCTLLLLLLFHDRVSDYLNFLSNLDLKSRDFDKVPNFSDGTYYGFVKRFLFWPLIHLTGAYLIFSLSVEYFLFFLSVLGKSFFLIRYCNLKSILTTYLLLGMVAFMAPGFTSYLRYAHPILFIIIMFNLLDEKKRKI